MKEVSQVQFIFQLPFDSSHCSLFRTATAGQCPMKSDKREMGNETTSLFYVAIYFAGVNNCPS